MKFVLCLFNSFCKIPHPQIIDSLLAIAIVFVCLIDRYVGSKPSIPVIAYDII